MIKGSHHTKEARRKIGDANRDRHPSEEARRKMGLAQSNRKGPKAARWVGGIRYRGDKRVYLYRPDHLFTTKKGYVLRARLVVERRLNRYLRPEEVVHHENGIKSDDRLENLRLFANQSEHMKYHEEVRHAHHRGA